MADITWKQTVYDSAKEYRKITNTTSGIKVGELPGKIGALNPVKFADEERWKFDCSASISAIEMDSDNYVYTGSGVILRKIDQEGKKVKEVSLTSLYGMALDKKNRIYIASSKGINCIDAGTFDAVWTYSGFTSFIYGIAYSSKGYIYATSYDKTVKKIDTQGNLVWSFTMEGTETGQSVCASIDGNYVYAGSDWKTVYKLNDSGSKIWKKTFEEIAARRIHTYSQNSVEYVYVGIEKLYKLDSYGNILWSYISPTGSYIDRALDINEHGNIVYGDNKGHVGVLSPSGQVISTYYGEAKYMGDISSDSLGHIFIGSGTNLKKISMCAGTLYLKDVGEQYNVVEFVPEEYAFQEMWNFTGHTDYVNGVAVDASGNVYSASSDKTVRKINSSGSQVWSFTGHTDYVCAVAVDAYGNVYSGSGDNTVRKINSSGIQVWSFTGDTVYIYAVAVDASGNVYSGGSGSTVQKINSIGSHVWLFTGHTDYIRAVAVDASGNVYSGGYDKTMRKINSSGTQVWSFTGHTGTVNAIAVDSSGNVYSGSHDKTVRKINSSGSQVWSFTGHTSSVYGVAVDSSGNVYSASTDKTVRKINSSGTQVWSFTGYTNGVNGVAVDASGYVYSCDDNTVRKIKQIPTKATIYLN